MTIPIFVISIPTSSRRPAMQKRMDAAGLSFEWWDAIDGRDKDPNEILGSDGAPVYSESRARLQLNGRAMNGGEVALSETTFRLYRHCLEMGFDHVAILEDDAWPQPHFPAVLADIETLEWNGIVRLFYPLYSSRTRWHKLLQATIWVGRRMFRKSGFQTPDEKPLLRDGGHTISESALRLGGAVGYTITPDAMRKVLQVVYPVRVPVDLYLQFREMHGVHSLHVSPACVVVKHNEIPSEVGFDEISPVLKRNPLWSAVRDDVESSWLTNLQHRCKLAIRWWLGKYVVGPFRPIFQLYYDLVRIRRYL